MWKLKLAGGILGALLLASLFAWGKIGWSNYHSESDKLHHLVGAVAEVSGRPKLQVKDSPAAVRAIGHDRDVYFSNWQLSKSALADQTDRVIRLGEERKAALALAERAQAQVATLKAQRDGWIRRAQAASTRTQRKAAEAEAAECEAAMDALYRAGF